MSYIRIDHLHPSLRTNLKTLIDSGAPVHFSIRGDDVGNTYLNMKYSPLSETATNDIQKGDYRRRSQNQSNRDAMKLREWQSKVDSQNKTHSTHLSPIPQLDGEWDSTVRIPPYPHTAASPSGSWPRVKR